MSDPTKHIVERLMPGTNIPVLKGNWIYGTNEREHCSKCGCQDPTGEECERINCSCTWCGCSNYAKQRIERQRVCPHDEEDLEPTEIQSFHYGAIRQVVASRCRACGAEL